MVFIGEEFQLLQLAIQLVRFRWGPLLLPLLPYFALMQIASCRLIQNTTGNIVVFHCMFDRSSVTKDEAAHVMTD